MLVSDEGFGLCLQDDNIAASNVKKMIVFLIKGFLLVNTCASKKVGAKIQLFFNYRTSRLFHSVTSWYSEGNGAS
jgi:hypothetical protein